MKPIHDNNIDRNNNADTDFSIRKISINCVVFNDI